MRNLINRILVVCMGALLFTQTVCSQTIFSQSETFDGNTHSFTSYLWEVTTSYSRSHTKSMAGYVPNISGDSVVLTSPSYNLVAYDGANVSVVLKFNHICKVSPQDIARIDYRIGINSWETIPVSSYMGTAANYAMYGFNAENYPKWKGEDSTATPSNGWWQEEIFDISSVKGNSIQIRFVLKHGNTTGSQVSYGWLIDDVGIYVSERSVEHPFIQFLGSYPVNTVYRTGPYDITVEAKSNAITKASLKPLYLKYTSLYNNVYTTDSVLMNNADGDTMWTASIPQFSEGTYVTYSITATDTNANSRSLYGGYAIKRLVNTPSGYVIAGTGQTANNNTPVCMNSNYGWSRQLYLAEEIEPIASAGGIITKLAWECTSENINVVYDRQTCYFQAVDSKIISNKNYENPVSVGAEQVWTGSVNITQGWVEITLDKPFLLLPEQNLVIHWVQKNGMHTDANWAHTVMSNTMCVYANNDIRFPSNPTNPSTDIVLTSLRPNARFYLQGSDYAANSAAILSMISPTQQSLQPGIANNVEILIRNTGSENLDSVTVNWTVNGGTVNSIQWYGNLSWDNQTTVSLNSFIPRANMYDSILVWLDMPNGVTDSTSWDDTLLVIFYGCSGGGISGSFTVGNGGSFANLDKAMEILDRCGANGNIELQLKSGTYAYGLDFQNFGDIMNGHRLIITSEAKNKDSVIFSPSSNYGVKLGQSKNITLEYLTFDLQQAKMHGIFINDSCSNITINRCAVLCDTVNTSQSFSAIYKTNNTGTLQHIHLTDNFINGGYRGIELDAGTSSQYGSDITVEGNTVKNANESNIYIRYANDVNIANNKILARSYGGNFYWYGIYASGISGNIQGNKINQQFATSTSVRGIYVDAMNQNNSTETGLIANNEVILDANKAVSTAVYYGIYVSNPNANIFHNSVFISNIGGTNPPCGIKIEGGTKVDVQNNNVVIESINGRPLEMPAVNQNIHNFKSNNFYASRNMARIASTDVPSADLWQSYFPKDVTTVSKLPAFIDNTVSLELSNYDDFLCTKVNDVSNDINNTVRGGTTSMGAYTQTPFTVNAMLTEIIGWQPASGQGSTLKLVFLNDGTSTINSANINWTFNNVPKTTVTLTKTLQAGESDTISLGNVNYTNGMNELKIWISQLASLTDEYKKNDTLQMSALVCGSMLNGTYTVGATGNFKTINEAVDALYTCGISGSVTFTVENGVYQEIVQFPGNITGSDANNTVTFISVNGDAQATVIQRKGATSLDNATLILNGVSNLTFKQITIDGRPAGTEDGAYFHAVKINSGCNNIEIDSCILINPLNSPKLLTTANYAVIHTPNGSILNNIRILNNTIKGGSHGIYIYGASGTRNKNIFIENNLINMVDNYGIYLYYTDSFYVYNNTIIQRYETNLSLTGFSGFYGIYCANFTGNVVKNRIYADLSLSNGIYLSTMSNVGTATANPVFVNNPAFIANNEIRGYATGNNYGICVAGKIHANIYHNSILINGTGTARGLYVYVNTTSNNIRVNVKNNNFAMMTSANDYPIYIGTATAAFLSYYDVDYNNYYSQKGANVGYAGAAKTTLSAWQATMTGDLNSVVEKPYFVDATNTLQPASNHGLSCPTLTGIVDDNINGTPRPTSTTMMGAYDFTPVSVDIHPASLSLSTNNPSVGTPIDLTLILHNAGTSTVDSVDIYWAINGVTTTNPYRWKGTLTAGTASSAVTVGNFNPVSGTNNIIVWTKPADGTTDNNLSNDTVKTAIYACGAALNGTYTIGTGGKFATMQDALFTLKTCGMNGAVRFEFLPNEIHTASFELTSISGLSAVNTITLTSQSGNAANTVLQAKKDMNVITLNGSPYIKISNLTLNARTGKRGIEMTGALPNIEISNCIILLDTLTTVEGDGKVGIYHSSGSANNLTDFRVTNNIIDGGYSAIHIVSNGSNRVCDSNIITNSGYRAIWCWGTGSTKNSISHNTIISRRENSAATWHGIFLNNGDLDKVEGNKIRTLSNQIPTVRGIEMQSVTGGDRLFINNEICIRSSTGGYGIGASNIINSLYHNSIYVESNGANALNLTAKPNNISYNNLIAGTSADVAIYISTNINDINMDYNNYYGVGNICRLGGANYASLASWQAATLKDIHSVSILPNFLDINTSLEFADTSALYCPVSSAVRTDINKQIRTTPTNIGAYGFPTNNLDMELSTLYNIPPSSAIAIGDILQPKLIITNTGLALLDSATIYWECNGVGQNVRWNNNPLASLANDTIDLGTFAVSQAGSYHLLIYATSVNNASTDMNQKNDTVRMSLLVCDSALSGTYVVGNTGVFSTITDAINQLHTCGVSNDVQFTLQNGIYSENIDLSELKDLFGSYKLDIVSASNIADSVIIQPSSNNAPVVLLGNSNNITLNAITIDATKSRSYGIEFVDSCTNITVYGCRFFADTVSAVNGNQCIYTRVNDNDYLSAITIENNILCGGFEGINMGFAKGSGIKISHNLLYNQYASGISLKNVDGANNKISFNTVRSRIANSNATWMGIAIEGSNIPINGNKIHQQDITVQTMYGIYLFYGYLGLVSNNEIIGYANSDAKGISVDLSSVNLLHNSIYLYGNAVQNGIFTAASDTNFAFKIHRNNIVLTSASGYPISMTENIATIKDINTNNYYAPNFIGRITSDFSTVYPVYIEYRSLPVWRVDVPTDVASVQVEPKFVDVSQSLNLADYTGLYCAKIADIPNDINDSSRTHPTTIGAYGLDILIDYDLSFTQIVDPANDLTSMCAPNQVAVRYALCNTGIATYDFSKDTVSLYFEVKGMKGDFDTVIFVSAGSLALMETDTFELISSLDVSFAGDYHITAWISSEKDTLHANDTLRMIYKTNKIALPYEETFSTSQPDLFIDNVVGTNGWHVVQGSDAMISPNAGTGMFVLGAYHGTISTIKIGQIELERTAQPKLEFWYAHDNSEPDKRDQMTVRVSWNSGLSEKIVHQIKRYDASYTTPNWMKYTVDLSPYVDSVCVAVSLEAISYGGIQHIDRITVTSNQNLALDTVWVSDYSLCDLNNKNISLLLANTTNQRINYAVTPTNIIVKISGLITKDTTIVLSGIMEGSEKDTILIADNLDLQKGTYTVNAFISSPVSDIDRKDDTVQRTISINPRLVPYIDPVSGGSSNCLSGEMDIFPVINLTNTGNVDMSNIELVLQIDTGGTNDPAYIILKDTCTNTIHAGENLSYSFKSSYKVPWSPDIYVRITARLLCNPALIDTSTAITECIDMKDLYLVSIDNPSSATTDKVGESIQVKVTLSNRYDLREFSNTDITVLVTNSQGVQMAKFTETKDIGILATTEHHFSRSYTVPNDTIYHLTVYTNSYDNYSYNDTITLKRNTVGVGIKSTEEMRSFTLGQNTPNPANGITRIDYSVPESGQVIFHIHSISGQLLHSETIETKHGTHSLELNTATFAAGVYFYSMEYKGQRIIKQLIINN